MAAKAGAIALPGSSHSNRVTPNGIAMVKRKSKKASPKEPTILPRSFNGDGITMRCLT